MKACPRCTTAAPDSAFKCKACGALLVAPPAAPAPAAPATSSPAVDAAPALSADEQFFAPVTVTTRPPIFIEPVVRPSSSNARHTPRLVAVVVVLLAVGATAAYGILRGGAHAAKAPIVLPPHDPSSGMPSSLDDVVRIQAESSRQTAFSAIAQARSENQALTPHALDGVNPALQWTTADQSSTGPREVSYAEGSDGTVTIAISASSKDVCAFGRLAPGAVGEYVTMGNVSSCRAADAPTNGWSTLRGGSATDLPPDSY